jgi:general secretion pathway protein C
MSKASVWWSRLATTGVWLLLGLSATYWLLQWRSAQQATAVRAPVASTAAPVLNLDAAELAKVLGATAAAPVASAPVVSASTRFNLVGVVRVAGRSSVAVIAVDGQAAKPYRVGSEVEPGFVLTSVGPKSADLAPEVGLPATMTLELPKAPGAVSVNFTPAPPAPAPQLAVSPPVNGVENPAQVEAKVKAEAARRAIAGLGNAAQQLQSAGVQAPGALPLPAPTPAPGNPTPTSAPDQRARDPN